jgi:small subunit ribosomal protein S2
MNKNVPTLEEMLQTGMHFGHRTNRWHPKMKQYIYGAKNGIYVLDLRRSQEKLSEALDFIEKLITENKNILFVGTKNQVSGPMKKMVKEIDQSYVVGKWLGGFLTNFPVIKKSVKKYLDLTEKKAAGKLEKYTKKERLDFDREIEKLEMRVAGLVKLTKLPDALFVWDIKEEETAVKEAIQKNIPIIAICDTNVNPELTNYPIPANDDSTKTMDLILKSVKKAAISAKSQMNK